MSERLTVRELHGYLASLLDTHADALVYVALSGAWNVAAGAEATVNAEGAAIVCVVAK